jgi:hypothetical protein
MIGTPDTCNDCDDLVYPGRVHKCKVEEFFSQYMAINDEMTTAAVTFTDLRELVKLARIGRKDMERCR